MSKHTPGPWQIHGSHIYSADPDRALLAVVFNPGKKASDYPLKANTALVAAAPVLLEALKALLSDVGEANSMLGARMARAAIAAANVSDTPVALPPLPTPNRTMWHWGQQTDLYTACQLRDYARSVIAATGEQP